MFGQYYCSLASGLRKLHARMRVRTPTIFHCFFFAARFSVLSLPDVPSQSFVLRIPRLRLGQAGYSARARATVCSLPSRILQHRCFHSSVGQSVRLLNSRSGGRASLGAFFSSKPLSAHNREQAIAAHRTFVNSGQQAPSTWSRGVTVSTLDSESSERGSNPRGTFNDDFLCIPKRCADCLLQLDSRRHVI